MNSELFKVQLLITRIISVHQGKKEKLGNPVENLIKESVSLEHPVDMTTIALIALSLGIMC